MTKNISTYFIALCFLIPAVLMASETRVNSTGGLSLVMTDESASVNPFNFGNPAGLSLLPPQSRFDIAAPWFQETAASDPSGQVQAYGTLSQLGSSFSSDSLLDATNSPFKYQGLILFPTSQWAFQASGDLLHATNQQDPTSIDEKSLDRLRGMARTAYNFGPFSLGTEIDINQITKDFPPGTSGSPDGQGNGSVLSSTSGLLLDIPLDNSKSPSHLKLGGQFAIAIPPSQEKDHFSLNISGNPVDLDFIYKSQNYMSFGPEVYLEVPDSFQAAVITRFNQSTVNYEQDSSNPIIISSIASYKLNDANATEVLGVFKGKLPLAGTLRQKLSLNPGGYLLIGNTQNTDFDQTGTTTQTSNISGIQAGIGIGVENQKDFTVGLQASMDSRSGTATSAGISNPYSYFGYSISAGGEKWVSAHWAIRMGLNFEDDYTGGSYDITKTFYVVPVGDRVVNTTLSAGVGFEDSTIRSDFMLWTGQPSIYDSSSPNAFATQAGVELALGVLFN